MTEHYFSPSPTSPSRMRNIEADLGGSTRSVLSAAGVFSPDGLDRGTAVLLRALSQTSTLTHTPPTGPILDIGCGWGAVALDAALTFPNRDVWAIDINERSRAVTAENARRLGLERVFVASPEQVPPELRFHDIRSNPPIRVGKQALHEIFHTWLPRLAPEANAYFVVAKHLGADSLRQWITREFSHFEVQRIAREKGFHVIRVRRP